MGAWDRMVIARRRKQEKATHQRDLESDAMAHGWKPSADGRSLTRTSRVGEAMVSEGIYVSPMGCTGEEKQAPKVKGD